LPFPAFDPVLVHIGPFAVRWYALAYIAGIILGWLYARSILRNDSEAEDVVQEAYVNAFAHLGAFRGDSSLATWVVPHYHE